MSMADKLAAILSGDIETILKLGPVAKIAGDTGRCAIGSEPGRHLVGADLIAIEACVGNWVADDEVELDRWRRFLADRTNIELDPYRIEGLNAGFPEAVARSRGKVLSLAFQYMGGTAAFRNLAPDDFVIGDDEIQALKWDWRWRHKKIKDCWDALDAAAVAAVSGGIGTSIPCGRVTFRCAECCGGTFLYVTLPGGRSIAYPFARIIKNKFGEDAVTFKDNARGQWLDYRTKSKKKAKPAVAESEDEDDGPEDPRDENEQTGGAYGGTWFENIVSGIARDLLAEAMLRVEAAGYPVVLHVHDEVVSEVPDGFGSVEEYVRLVEQLPDWAQGIPVGAKGRNGPRFAKVELPIEHVPGGFIDEPLPVKPQPKGEAKPKATNGAPRKSRKKPAAHVEAELAGQMDLPLDPRSAADAPPPSCLDEALRYAADLNWFVFPSPPNTKEKKSYLSKRQTGANWGMTKKADEIRADWKHHPLANVGVPTGSVNQFWVLEADTLEGGHDHDGVAALAKLVEIHGPLPETRRAESPSGSKHWCFQLPKTGAPVRNSTSEIPGYPGIDTRGEGGMVIVPPSVRNGGAYRWISEAPIAEAPDWLLALVPRTSSARVTEVTGPAAGNGEPIPDDMLAMLEAAAGHGVEPLPSIEELRAAVEAIPNDAEAWGALGWLEPDQEVVGWKAWNDMGLRIYASSGGSEEGRAIFHEWSKKWGAGYNEAYTDKRWNDFRKCPPNRTGFDKIEQMADEADPTWRLGIGTKAQEQAGAENTDPGGDGEGIPFLITAEMKAALAGFGFTPEQVREMTPEQAWKELRARDWTPPPKAKPAAASTAKSNLPRLDEWDAGERLCGPKPRPRPWLTAKHFCRGYLSSLVARGGVGKTTLRLTQAIELASGRSLLGWPILRRCRVLVLCLEDDEEELHRRLLAICLHHNVDPAELKGWLFCRALQGVKLAELEGRGLKARKVAGALYPMLEDAIAERHYELVILDPFVKLHALAENDNSDMEFVCNLLLTLARKFNVALDSPAHTHKGATAPGDSNARRGGSAQRDADRIDFTLTVMSADEAKRFGVPADDRDDYVRLDSAKVNMIRAVKAQWFKLVGVRLGNADETYKDGDEVQAVERWEPTPTWAGADGKPFSSAALDAILDDIDAGMPDGRLYSEYQTAKERAAWRVVQKHCPEKPEAQCQEMIKQWVEVAKVLTRVQFYSKGAARRKQWGLKLNRSAKAETECDDD
jgi:hypothetical protein